MPLLGTNSFFVKHRDQAEISENIWIDLVGPTLHHPDALVPILHAVVDCTDSIAVLMRHSIVRRSSPKGAVSVIARWCWTVGTINPQLSELMRVVSAGPKALQALIRRFRMKSRFGRPVTFHSTICTVP